MIEGRSGGSWRGTRRELWAPPTAVRLNQRIAGLYRVHDSRPEPFTAPPSHFLPSAASSPVAPACWPQGNFCRHPSARSALHSSPQNGGPRSEEREGRNGGSWRGT